MNETAREDTRDETGDSESPTQDTLELVRLLQGARDSMNDDMVARLADTLGEGLQLLDRANRSGIERALPTLQQLIDNGDLDRLAHLARALGASEDALTEDMVGRLAGTAGDGLELLDRVNRSGIDRALPAISQLIDNGDLDRIVQLARVVASVEDTLNDEMVARLAQVAGDALCLLERLTRNGALNRVLDLLLRPEVQNVLVRFGEALVAASHEFEEQPPPRGGVLGLWRIASQPGNQEAMQFLGLFGNHLRDSGPG